MDFGMSIFMSFVSILVIGSTFHRRGAKFEKSEYQVQVSGMATATVETLFE
jgi:uncharacterized membrane protein